MGMDRRSFGGFLLGVSSSYFTLLEPSLAAAYPESPSPLFVHGLLVALQIKQCVHFVLPQQRT
jgi:hypothetical protein